MTINLELEKLYQEDKAEREVLDMDNKDKVEVIEQSTSKRIEKLKKLISNKEVDLTEIWNLHYLAYLLQHSEDLSDYKLAHKYAAKAVSMGSSVTKWLYAVTLDRSLVAEGKKQKFGTQYKLENGKWVTQPVDESTTDEERKEFGVKPLKEYLSRKYK